MHIKVLALGKLKEKFLKEGILEFQKRLTPYANFEIIELQPVEIRDENLIQKALDEEAQKLLAYIKPQSYVITLEIGGKMLSSEDFARKISDLTNEGFGEIIFVIGSSCGLSKIISDRADFKLSFSRMTFPHQLMQMILLEQIYRGYRILNHEPYHK